MIDFSKGYSATWRVMRVNPDTWADADELPNVSSIAISRSSSGSAPLIESGTVSVTTEPGAAFSPGWYRIEMLARQGDEVELHPMATLYLQSSDGTADRGADTLRLEGTSVLKPADGTRLLAGHSAPAGCDGAAFACDLIASCTPAPVAAEGSFTLDAPYVFPANTTCLQAAWMLLDAAGWCIEIDGEGNVAVKPMPSEPSLVLDAAGASSIVPGIRHRTDASKAANRYWAVDGESTAVAVNEDPASPTSVGRVGFHRDVVDTAPVRIGGETLQAYAERKLSEASVIRTEYSYTREYAPGVTPFSIVRAAIPSIGFEGDLRVTSQSVRCDTGATVSETAAYEEVTYPWA